MPAVGLVILAAGASTRLKGPKQLLAWRGKPLVRHAVDTAIASICRPIVVVLGANSLMLREHAVSPSVTLVENQRWREGLSTSIRSGVTMVMGKNVEAVVIMTIDQPFLTAPIIDQLVSRFNENHHCLVASRYASTLGVPALFPRRLFGELTKLTGDRGAKSIITKHQADALTVDFPEGAQDIDTPEDYQDLCAAASQQSSPGPSELGPSAHGHSPLPE